MLKLSVTNKLDGIKSWSLQARETCPASIGVDGELVDACKGCYATTGNYRFANVKAPREFNREDWKRDAWVSDMVQALSNERFFRWFDSGDMYDLRLAKKIYEVMKNTPWVSHWLPTRMAKFPKFQEIIAQMHQLPNVVVRFSSDAVDGSFVHGVHGSTIVPANEKLHGVEVCQAYEHGGKCNGCRKCWDKSVPVIGYVAHGRKMAKVIRLKASSPCSSNENRFFLHPLETYIMQTTIKRILVKSLLIANDDKFVGVTFTKKDGQKRNLNGRLHVRSKTGKAPTTAHIPEYLTIYDVKARGFRTINLDTVESIRMKGGEFKVR